MKPLPILALIVFYFSCFTTISAQSSDKELLQKIESINTSISDAFNQESTEKIVSWYAPEAICMPEYHLTITGTTDISKYYNQWFEKSVNKGFQKKAFTVERLGNYILETGNFTSQFSITDTGFTKYDGKYIRCWTVEKNKPSKIIMEIWGSSSYADRSVFPQILVSETTPKPMQSTENPFLEIVKKRNSLIAQLVKERKGAEHAKLFTSQAIYMPYYLPMQIGKDAITAYFTEHEKPGDVSIDAISINTGSLLNAGFHIIEFGYYNVSWRAGKDSGTVTGKSINVWKKETSGEWMLSRQMVNHD